MKVNIGVIGVGKRFLNVYLPLIKKLDNHFEIGGFFTRTRSNGVEIENKNGLKYFESIEYLLEKSNPDILLVCVNENVSLDIISTLENFKNKLPILIETPVTNIDLVRKCLSVGFTVSVAEQWPYLPLEQFKKSFLDSCLISQPFLVQNDCRSFDYHAIAQLRTYLGRDNTPKIASGQNITIQSPLFLNNKDKEDQSLESWDIGSVKFNNGAILVHNFSYLCKTAPYRTLQSLRIYSENGSVLTGKINNKDNDYEILDFRFLNNKETETLNPIIKRDENGNVRSITSSMIKVMWENPYKESLTDQESAIAHLLQEIASGRNVYSVKDAFIDNLIISGIKQSCMREGMISFPQL